MQTSTSPYAVLWDLDGVLVDTGELHYQTFVAVLDELNISLDRAAFARTFGMNNTGIFRLLLGDPSAEQIEQLSDHKESLFRAMLPDKLHALPGVLQLLERLSAQGIPMAVASSAPMENIDLILSELGIRAYFRAIVSGALMPGKPDPAVFLEAALRLEMPPQRCIVIEDSIPGVQAAKSAGMKCLATLTTNPAEALQAADLIIERLELLPEDTFERMIG